MYVYAGRNNVPLKETTNVSKPPGLAQKQLRLRAGDRKKALDPVYRPLPQVTKTSLYDEHWVAKQERGTFQIKHMILHYNSVLYV